MYHILVMFLGGVHRILTTWNSPIAPEEMFNLHLRVVNNKPSHEIIYIYNLKSNHEILDSSKTQSRNRMPH